MRFGRGRLVNAQLLVRLDFGLSEPRGGFRNMDRGVLAHTLCARLEDNTIFLARSTERPGAYTPRERRHACGCHALPLSKATFT